MNTSTQILPGIKFIGWIDCRYLQRRVDLTAICQKPIPVFTEVHAIDFFGEPDCRCQRKKEGAAYEENASLKFLTDTELPNDITIGFVVKDVNDNSFLIGSLEAPHPIVEFEHNTGIPSTQSGGFQYEVKHVALKTLIPCHF